MLTYFTHISKRQNAEQHFLVELRPSIQELHDHIIVTLFIKCEKRLELILEEQKNFFSHDLGVPILQKFSILVSLNFGVVSYFFITKCDKIIIEVLSILKAKLLSICKNRVLFRGLTHHLGMSLLERLECLILKILQ